MPIRAFGWYGGKYSHLDWLLPLIPLGQTYIEPFGGSAAVLLNRPRSPVEVYNDSDSELVNFFRVLRNEGEELRRRISLTPFSREEYTGALIVPECLPDVERARMFYVRARQVRTGMAQCATIGRWASCRENSRSGMAASVSRWLGGDEGLAQVAARLLTVQLEWGSAIDVIDRYDGDGSVIYVDPPYMHESRGDVKIYRGEMGDSEHEELARKLYSCRGRVVLSLYDCRLAQSLYRAPKWRRIEGPEITNHSSKGKRRELVLRNFD